MSSEQTLARFADHRCSAILRTPHADAVVPAMDAAIEGGFRIVEFTLNTPGALDHIRAYANSDEHPDLLVGAGTVLSVEDARAAADAGARFLVSPVADADVIRFALDHDLVAIPGTATPTEALTAHRLGAQILKVFPGPADGPAWVRTVRGPLPFLRLFPTSGVTLENASDYLAAGSFGLGFVNCLFDPGLLANGRFDQVRQRAEAMVRTVEAADRPERSD